MALRFAFRSGMSRLNDMRGAIEAGVPIGAVATEIQMICAMNTLPSYLAAGGAVFIDSGAFSELSTKIVPNFNRVLNVYEMVAEMADLRSASLANLYIVSPDKVGDQIETLRRIRQYRERILGLIDLGCQVIVPIQRGEMAASAMLAAVKDVLGSNRFVAGVPSNKEAMTIEECAALKHHAFHILGRVQMDEAQEARIEALRSAGENVQITADANWLRSRMAMVCGLKDEIDEARKGSPRTLRERIAEPKARTLAVAAAITADTRWASYEHQNDPDPEEPATESMGM